jgi:hypothetical protein
MIVAHPLVAMALHYWAIRGKKGKDREVLGAVKKEPADAGLVRMTFGIAKPRLTFGADGSVTMESNVKLPKGFRLDLFRRALHHIGLNVLAHLESVDSALDPKFDSVRNYVRRPRSRAEAWPYAEHSPPIKTIPRVLWAGIVASPIGKIVAMQLFQTMYAVDLLDSGDLRRIAQERGATFVDTKVVDLPEIVIRMGGAPQPPPPV